MLDGFLATIPKRTKGEAYEEGTKILQLDRKTYFGSESVSLNLSNLWKHYRQGT